MLAALFSLLTTLLLVSAPMSSSSSSVSKKCALQVIATMELVESSVWLLWSWGCHKKTINVLQERMSLPVFCNLFGGDSIGGAGEWL